MTGSEDVEAWAPGRVNLIGDHTDYMGGFALPMAIHLGTTVRGHRRTEFVELTSRELGSTVRIPLDIDDPRQVEPAWGRYVAGVVARMRPTDGFVGTVESTLPIGSGLSSSASLEVAVALALGHPGPAARLAEDCRDAEQMASGVPCGIMDQLAIASGVEGNALLLDCLTLEATPVALDPSARFTVVHSGTERSLDGSAYAERRAQCEAAEAVIGHLRSATLADLEQIDDPVAARRARHVLTENERVTSFVASMAHGDLAAAGSLMHASHCSLRDEFAVSTPELDGLVERLMSAPGVFGARLTGAGFGGCVVALSTSDLDLDEWAEEHWVVKPSAGSTLRRR